LREAPRTVPLMSVRETLSDRRVLLTSAMLVVINVATIVGFGIAQNGSGIAWEAHLGGYCMGLFTYGLFDDVRGREEERQQNDD